MLHGYTTMLFNSQVPIFAVFQYNYRFYYIICHGKPHQSLQNFVVNFINVCNTIWKNGDRKPKYCKWKRREILWIASHGFTDAENSKCVFWIAEGHELTVDEPHAEQNTEYQAQRALAFVNGIRTTTLQAGILTWVKMDVLNSMMKRKKCLDPYSKKSQGCL